MSDMLKRQAQLGRDQKLADPSSAVRESEFGRTRRGRLQVKQASKRLATPKTSYAPRRMSKGR